MISFDTEKNGYNKEQVMKYFELVQKEYEGIYSENQTLRAELEQARQHAGSKTAHDIPPDRMEAIALALIDAETEAQRIVNAARDKAWQIITDAKKGLPIPEDPVTPSLEAAVPQPQKPAAAPEAESTVEDLDKLLGAMDDMDRSIEAMDDLDKLIESILSENWSGGD